MTISKFLKSLLIHLLFFQNESLSNVATPIVGPDLELISTLEPKFCLKIDLILLLIYINRVLYDSRNETSGKVPFPASIGGLTNLTSLYFLSSHH